jgi:hypothetical protein
MKHTPLILLAALAACSFSTAPTEVDVPSNLTPVPVTTDFEPAVWTDPPRVTFNAVPGGIRFAVERQHLCAMIAGAGARTQIGSINVYATVSHNPAAMCVALATGTSEYEGVVPAQRNVTYSVALYERVGDGRARLIGRATITAQ